MNYIKNDFKNDQKGIVSIIVTIVVASVITLLIIGFASVTRREQRQALDRQLSTQAFYAAESGINDVTKILNTDPSLIKENLNDCNGTIDDLGLNNNLDSEGISTYTCLLVDPDPTELEYSNVEVDASMVIPLKSVSGNISEVTIAWKAADGDETIDGSCPYPQLPAVTDWSCGPGIMRLDIADTPEGVPTSRVAQLNRLRTIFLYPSNSGAKNGAQTDYYGIDKQGPIEEVRCDNSGRRQCSFTVNGFDSQKLTLRLRSIYRRSSVSIVARGGSPLVEREITGVQMLVDSTGRSTDVLRRMQVRIATSDYVPSGEDFAIHSIFTTCKRFEIPQNGSNDITFNVSNLDDNCKK